ncbi:InlB B-repeat-containing protein [Leifsonia sp. A12D58]|uniref:InlB B-repeat-containing protein n=1 Tax=Leifsonia sp. A12D58 TaxID=3397674 RepID=UPI0039DF60AD
MADWRMNPARFVHRFHPQPRHRPAQRAARNVLSGVFAFASILTLGFGVALLPAGDARATDASPAAPAAPPREVTTAAELMTAITEASTMGESMGQEIRLTADIVVASLVLPTGATVIIDLDGHSLLVQPVPETPAMSPVELIASATSDPAVRVQSEATLTLTGDGVLDARGSILIDGVFDNRSVVTASASINVAGVLIDSGTLTPPVTVAPSTTTDFTTALTRLVFHPNLAGFDDDTIRLYATHQLATPPAAPVASVLPKTVQDAARSGFTFVRPGHSLTWTTAADAAVDHGGVGDLWDASAALGPDLDLFAQWTANRHTVIFDSAGGSAVAPQTTDYGKTIGMPADPVKAGFTFAGWMLASTTSDTAGTGTRWNPSTAVTSDLTLYASWTPVQVDLVDTSVAPAADALSVDRAGQRTWSSADESDTAPVDSAAANADQQASAAGSMPWMWIGLIIAGVAGMAMIPRGSDS